LNKIYFGDNLDVLRKHIKDESVDLIYLDPPFNSKRAYNIVHNKEAQFKAFDDTWHWTDETAVQYEYLLKHSTTSVANTISSFRTMLDTNNMMAYLTMMTPRLMELHRVLKDTGSIYLHCDPTASHYLKIIMDNIFGIKNFQNEIVWCYRSGGATKKRFSRKHDVLFFYSKEYKKFNYNCIKERVYYDKPFFSPEQDEEGRYYADVLPVDWWTGIQPVLNLSKERTEYPTQKPLALLERIIKASSNKGDIILDPFCGCATTMIASEKLGRQWIGIDIVYQSVVLLKERLRKNSIFKAEYSVEGEPTTLEGVESLIKERGEFRFQDWIIGRVKGGIPNDKKTADKGVDGLYFWEDAKRTKKAIISVKSGIVHPSDIRDLAGTVDSSKADAGIFLTLKEPTPKMKEVSNSYEFIYDCMGKRYPKIQILTVQEILDRKKLNLP